MTQHNIIYITPTRFPIGPLSQVVTCSRTYTDQGHLDEYALIHGYSTSRMHLLPYSRLREVLDIAPINDDFKYQCPYFSCFERKFTK